MKRRKSISKKPPLWSKFTQSRTTCRACSGPLETVLDLGVQQIVNLGDKEKRSAPLELTKCQSCSLVQLRHTVDREYLFRSYYYRSGATQTMRDHLKGVVDDVMKRVELKDGDCVVDIGSNDGTLLSLFPKNLRLVGFEPSDVMLSGFIPSIGGIVNRFFSAEAYLKAEGDFAPTVKAVVAVAMFYDLDDPNAFLRDIKKILAPDGLLLLQINYLPDTLRNNAVGDICHEHLCYYSLTTLRNLLLANGFYVEDISFNQINGGSIRIFAELQPSIPHDMENIGYDYRLSVVETVSREKKLNLNTIEPFRAFADRISTIARKTREHVELLRKMGRTVSVIGASTRGAAFLQYAGLAPKYGLLLDCVERDPSKVGKHYLGMKIISEDEDRANPADWYLLTTNWFKDEILKRMPHARRFLVPLPEPRIVVDGVETSL